MSIFVPCYIFSWFFHSILNTVWVTFTAGKTCMLFSCFFQIICICTNKITLVTRWAPFLWTAAIWFLTFWVALDTNLHNLHLYMLFANNIFNVDEFHFCRSHKCSDFEGEQDHINHSWRISEVHGCWQLNSTKCCAEFTLITLYPLRFIRMHLVVVKSHIFS